MAPLVASTTVNNLIASHFDPQTSVFIGLLVAIATVVIVMALAYLGYQYFATEKDLNKSSSVSMASPETYPVTKPQLKISHSLPDIQHETTNWTKSNNNNSNKVLRQTTLPVVPNRHQTFQRQLSQNIDLSSSIKFDVRPVAQQQEPVDIPESCGIKVELYRPELVQQSSIDSCSPSEAECGRLHFTLRYDHDVEGLFVKTTNPVFNETFVFGVSYRDLRIRTLQMSVYDLDRFSRNDLIGHVVLRGLLDNCDLSQEVEYLMDILHRKQEKLNLGELMLSMCYLPTAGRLIVTVIKACNLRAMDITGSSDPYVKVILTCMGKRIKKKKTTVKKATLNPVYNEALVFDIPPENCEDVSLVVNVIDYDRVGPNEMMGSCIIGANVIGIGRDHWQEMLDNPRKPVAQWYQLTMDSSSMLEEQSLTDCHSGHIGVRCLR
ncbi:hypothetical protein CHUAL_003927 [Chamberlinius hualienensis]